MEEEKTISDYNLVVWRKSIDCLVKGGNIAMIQKYWTPNTELQILMHRKGGPAFQKEDHQIILFAGPITPLKKWL